MWLVGPVQKTGQLYSDAHAAMSRPVQEAATAEAAADQDSPVSHNP